MLTCRIQYNDQTKNVPLNKMTFFEELYIDIKVEHLTTLTGLKQARRIQATIHPKQDVVMQGLELVYNRTFQPTERVFCNGFQSWSESREFNLDEEIPSLRRIAHPLMGNYGDYHIPAVKRGKGLLHSWTYGYIRKTNGIELIGSLTEQSAFTIIQSDTQTGQIFIQKDIDQLQLTHSYPILDIVILEGTEDTVFDNYFDLMPFEKPTTLPAVGWTSWYNYYTNISEEIILKNLKAFKKHNYPRPDQYATIFQIDDGFQTKVGDWLSIKPSFPNGMRPIAKAIHEKGYEAGLWLAPFICEKGSDIATRNPHWLLKDKNGKLVRAGYNPGWSGHFYVLDFYLKEVQDYLLKVFQTVLEVWGFDMVKLDFLYAVCILPRPNKTRGQVMYDAMQFIRSIVGKKKILGCGVPLGSVFGLVDYCRIGADIHLKWEHRLLHFLRNRERVSTIIALRSAIGRRHLNKRAFINDPDVFILRDENNQLTPAQQHTILILNILLGDLLFTSDYLKDYSPEQLCEYKNIYLLQKSELKSVKELQKDCYKIDYVLNKRSYTVFSNLTKKEVFIGKKNQNIAIQPFETIILNS